jgi:Domain of Unknown Function (DUF748)
MRVRRWLALGVLLSLVAAAGIRLALPELIRWAVVGRVEAITGRPVSLDGVDVVLRRGHVALRGFRLADRPGESEPFAAFERLDLHLRLSALLRGHLWLREAILRDSTVRVIRYPSNEFNLSNLVRQSGQTQRVLDVTVDRFVVVNGTATLEDRALPAPRTWRSEQMAVEAHNLSTRPQYGTAVATSVTDGAPVSVRVDRLRLYPIDLQATVTIDGLDLALGRVYLPPDAPVVLDRGRASTSIRVALEAREGLRLDAAARLEDVLLTRRGGEALARVPGMTATVDGLHFRPGGLALRHLGVDGAAAVADPSAAAAGRFASTTIRARVADLTWPVSGPAALDLSTRVEGRGSLAVTGTLRPPTAPSELRVRVAGFDLAPWARFAPIAARVAGIVEADLRVNEPLGAGVPSRVRGTVAVRDVGVADGQSRLLQARRIEASGLEVHWPERLRIGRLALHEPRALVERDRTGAFPLARLWAPPAGAGPADPADPTAPAPARAAAPSRPAPGVDIGQVQVQEGQIEWRDQTVTPPVRATVSGLAATATGAGWPITRPLDLRLAGRPPGGGELQLAGRLGLAPFSADTRVTARGLDLAPYQPYLGTPASVSAWADLDLAVTMPAADAPPAVRGSVALARVEVRDGERTVLQAERAAVRGLQVDWPRQVTAAELALEAPWILVERDERGILPIRALLPGRASDAASPSAPSARNGAGPAPALNVAVERIRVADGGVRVVDRSVSPAFALDLRRLALQAEGVSQARGATARVGLTGQPGPGTALAVRGTVGPIGGSLQFDLTGELQGFAVPRANPYLVRQVAWQARDGLLTTRFRARVQDEALDARVDVQLSRLQLARAAPEGAAPTDGAGGAGGGLPLNLVVALMRDSRGEIRVSVPVGGRLDDPRFDFREAIRAALRTVAVKTITLPVSWIGKLHVSPDSRIERVQIDPIRFQPAAAMPTAEGRAQVARVAAFLGQVGEVRMGLTPVVSAHDLGELRRRAAEAAVDRLAAEARIPRDQAATRLLRERRSDRPVPETPDDTLAALADTEASPALAPGLATRRLETVLALLQEAGVPPGRLVAAPLVERPDSTEGAVELALLEPDAPRRSQLLQFLRGLGGTAPEP